MNEEDAAAAGLHHLSYGQLVVRPLPRPMTYLSPNNLIMRMCVRTDDSKRMNIRRARYKLCCVTLHNKLKKCYKNIVYFRK
jgi:hypothetical protein